MRGKKLRKKDLTDGQIVFIEFDTSDISLDGSEDEYYERVEELAEEFKDGLFKVNLKNENFENLTDKEDIPLAFTHNFISDIYEWIT